MLFRNQFIFSLAKSAVRIKRNLTGLSGLMVICLLHLPLALTAQTIDQPAAIVRLHKTDVISIRQLKSHIDLLQKRTGQQISADQRKDVLDLLVGEKLIEQDSEKLGISISIDDLNKRIEQLRLQEGQRLDLKRPLTEIEYRSIVGQMGLGWESYQDQLRKAMVQEVYIQRTNSDAIRKVETPTEKEVIQFYEENKIPAFVQPDLVLFKHIFIDTRILTEAVQRNRARNLADDIFRELNNGAEFDELVIKYSDDESSRYSGGTFPMYLRRDDKSTMEQLGKSFFDEVFAMSLGETSDVLSSNMGFHIIKITEKIDARILGLDDLVNPQSVNKVKDQISALLAANLKTQAYQQALVGAISNLKGKSDLQIFQDNLEW